MKYNILAEFNFEGRRYVFYTLIDKPNNLLYGYYDSDIIKPVINLKEMMMMKEASRQIFVSTVPSNHAKLNIIRYNGKLFQVMYDKVSKLLYFYEIRDDKLYLPTDEDLFNLSSLYNREKYNSGSTNSDEDEEWNLKRLKRVIKIAGLYVVVLVSAIGIFKTYIEPGFVTEGQTYEQPFETPKPIKVPKTEFSLEKLEEALQSNSNLTDNEKIFLKGCLIVLDESSQSVEMDAELERLKTLITRYNQDLGPYTDGTYSPGDNSISLAKNLDFDNMTPEEAFTLVHEFFHCLSHPNYGVANGLFEALTSGLACEFLGVEGGSYFETRQYLNMLCEIIGPEPILAAYFSGDINCIISSLKQIIPDEELAYQLIDGINDFWTYSYAFVLKPDLSEEEVKANLDMSRAVTNHVMGQYFLAAKGYPMEEDAIMLTYQHLVNGPEWGYYVSMDEYEMDAFRYNFSMKKGYFLNSYIAAHPKATVEIATDTDFDNESFFSYVVDDSNRRLTPSTINEGAYVLQPKLLTEGVKKD